MDEFAMESAFEPNDWLRQNEALRRVARALVRDESRVDDVVQNAYLAALERPPLRLSAAWLRRVVRSRAFDSLRGEKRRREVQVETTGLPPAPDFTLELHS
jgi:DNA-directed RNA polymerase specialized sigma24 family protein